MSKPPPPPTILVVDDEPDIRLALSDFLEVEGYLVELAANGREALDKCLDGTAPDLIVLDLNMPVVDGWEFLASRDRNQKLRAIPVIVVTAHTQSARELGVPVLRKPFFATELFERIKALLSQANA